MKNRSYNINISSDNYLDIDLDEPLFNISIEKPKEKEHIKITYYQSKEKLKNKSKIKSLF